MWAKLPKKRQLLLAVVAFVVVVISSTAVGLLFNQQSQPQAKEEVQPEERDIKDSPNKETKEEAEQEVNNLLEEAKQHYYQGDYEGSIALYKEIIADFDSLVARENLAAVYQELGNYEAGLEQYQSIAAETNSAADKLAVATAYYNTGQFEKATAELKALTTAEDLERDYLYQEAYYYLAKIDQQAGNFSAAEEHLEQALEYQPWALGYAKLGDLAYQEEDYEQAVKHYQQSISTDGSLKGVHKKLAFSYLELNNFEKGAHHLQRAQRETKSDPQINQKITELEEQYPEYFKDDPREAPTRDELPEEVDFKEINPLPEAGQQLRIGLMTEQPRIYSRVGSEFEIVKKGQVVATGQKGDIIAAEGNKLEVGGEEFSLAEPIIIRPTSYAPVLVHQVEYGAGYYWGGRMDMQYRGAVEIRKDAKGLTAVNVVPLEAYLMAVVPSEMSASWPLEALKVQSVAARSYTLANLDKHKSESYDLCATVHCAAYRGITREHEQTNQAVKKTAGEIMTHDGRPINAVYSANSGGHTENSEDVWNFAVPYLKGVSTQEQSSDFPLPPAELKRWVQETPESYSQSNKYTKASHYRWQRELSVDYLEPRLGVEDIQQILPTNRGVGGSVEAVLVKGADEEKKIKSGLRYKFGGLRSNRFWIQPQYQDGEVTSFIFYGGGWGHNVGMDQVAVASMADNDHQYREILKHFYTDIKFESVGSD